MVLTSYRDLFFIIFNQLIAIGISGIEVSIKYKYIKVILFPISPVANHHKLNSTQDIVRVKTLIITITIKNTNNLIFILSSICYV